MSQTISLNLEKYQRNDEAYKMGMWLFIFTEILLFAGLFIIYLVYRYMNPEAFHLAARELSAGIGTLNTVILLSSSATIALATSAMRRGNSTLSLMMLITTFLLALMFIINKYFEWKGNIGQGLFPGSATLKALGNGDLLFYGLYYCITGLHVMHTIIGVSLLSYVSVRVEKDTLTQDNPILLQNSGLYWHFVVLIWIFLFPLFYLIT